MKSSYVARLAFGAAFAMALAWAAPVGAQQSVTTNDAAFAGLEQSLQPGDTVTITHLDGRQTKGKLIEVGDGIMRVRLKDESKQVAASDVQKVQRTRMSLLLGTIIGAGVGAALGGLAYAGCDDCDQPAVMVLSMAGIGAGVGCGVDALVNLPHTVYQRQMSRVLVAPTVTPGGGGVTVALRF